MASIPVKGLAALQVANHTGLQCRISLGPFDGKTSDGRSHTMSNNIIKDQSLTKLLPICSQLAVF